MELNEYQKKAMETCLPESENEIYMLLEIGEEIGEMQGKVAKAVRHGNVWFDGNRMKRNLDEPGYGEFMDGLVKEIGDVLWGLAGLCHVIGCPLDLVAKINLEKLASRKQRNVIDGSGDNR